MTGRPNSIEWYIARDGRQHGPMTDAMMQKFVELGHMKPGDLVWRAGFTDWRPALEVFAIPQPQSADRDGTATGAAKSGADAAPTQQVEATRPGPAAEPAAQQPVEGPAAAKPAPAVAGSDAPSAPASSPAPHVAAREPTTHPNPGEGAAGTAGQPAAAAGSAASRQPAVPRDAARPYGPTPVARDDRQPAYPDAGQRSGGAVRPDHAADYQRMADALASRPEPTQGVPGGQPGGHHSRADTSWRSDPEAGAPGEEPPAPDRATRRANSGRRLRRLETAGSRRRGFLFKFAIALMVGGIVAAGYVYRDQVLDLINAQDLVGPPAPVAATRPPGAAAPEADASLPLLSSAAWKALEREFPEWSVERQRELSAQKAEKRDNLYMTRHLTEAIVALRRKYVAEALASPPPRLRAVAKTFADNLAALGRSDVDACYGMVARGETSPQVIERLSKAGSVGPLQAQIAAVIDAIGEGRKQATAYVAPRKSDYDVLTRQLTSMGWSEQDLQMFSDPAALSRAPHDRVCKLVREWFEAQLKLSDEAIQMRLLVESLRPLISG